MKSFSVIRTNPGLTTNTKVIVTASYSLYMEAIESSAELSASKYKHMLFNKDNYYDELVPHFFKGTPPDIAFHVKYEDDSDQMFNTFDHQFDDIYQMGCKYISDTFYSEEFECFAPLYIFKNAIPENFIILRVDGPGIIDLTKDNFKTELLNKFKCVKVFDLTPKSNVGEWIKKNFKDNPSYPTTPLELDWRQLEFSKWSGIEYESGGYCSKSFFLDETMSTEQTFHAFESLVSSGYKNNKVVFSNIVNFSFLFDDTPATSKALRKWSINRYFGFYIDKFEEILSVSPYQAQKIVNGSVIKTGNILETPDGGDPFIGGWTINSYVEIYGVFHKVEQFTETIAVNKRTSQRKGLSSDIDSTETITKYRIIADQDLTGLEGLIDANVINIDSTNVLSFTNNQLSYAKLVEESNKCDLFLININEKWHVLRVNDSNQIVIQSDYAFKLTELTFEYWINEGDSSYRTILPLIIDEDNQPPVFKIYKINFTDIKDFDTNIVDTNFSKYEYEKSDSLTETQQLKLYTKDLESNEDPRRLSEYVYNKKMVHIPASSEYNATGELFEIENNQLNTLWRKNDISVKWGYQNSNAHFDDPYRMNNSLVGDDFNRTANTFETRPVRMENNLDYFYTINSSTTSYIEQSLHVQILDSNGNLDTTFKFNPDLLFNGITMSYGTYSGTISYFSSLFNKKESLGNNTILRNTKKHSNFNTGDSVVTNHTIFKGIKFYLYAVDKLIIKNDTIDSLVTKATNIFEDYKFTILMSDSATGSIFPIQNTLTWETFANFNQESTYNFGDKFIYDDIIYAYLGKTSYTFTSMNQYPGSNALSTLRVGTVSGPYAKLFDQISSTASISYYDTNPYITYTPYGTIPLVNTILWNPGKLYNGFDVLSSITYNFGDYYSYSVAGTISFWDPNTSYLVNKNVNYAGKYYRSLVSSNQAYPNDANYWTLDTNVTSLVDSGAIIPNWLKIPLWNRNTNSKYVVHNDIVYQFVGIPNISIASDEPGTTLSWTRAYSIVDDTTYQYNNDPLTGNNLIKFNNRYYYSTATASQSTLENGANVYINNNNKEITLHIYVNDNTYGNNIRNVNRDDLYTDIFSKLTAHNIINYINNPHEKYGFSDTIKYFIDSTTQSYNWSNLPYILLTETPDQVDVKLHSYSVDVNSPNKNLIKPIYLLDKATIKNISQLNYYNDIPLATNIRMNKGDNLVVDNEHGLKNLINASIWRFSGYYMPIFYEIDLFDKTEASNCKFDTTLTNFGKMKERRFSKINRKTNILKFKNQKDINSIYPMLDEYGYGFRDRFIFKSTWDNKYYIESDVPSTSLQNITFQQSNINNTP